jgi:hypothetical protein
MPAGRGKEEPRKAKRSQATLGGCKESLLKETGGLAKDLQSAEGLCQVEKGCWGTAKEPGTETKVKSEEAGMSHEEQRKSGCAMWRKEEPGGTRRCQQEPVGARLSMFSLAFLAFSVSLVLRKKVGHFSVQIKARTVCTVQESCYILSRVSWTFLV